MIKKSTTYRFYKCLFLTRNLIVCSFLLVVLLKPIVSYASFITDEKYETFQDFDKNSAEEKENIVEFGDEILNKSIAYTIPLFSKEYIFNTILLAKNSICCHEIHVPPPDLSVC